MGPGNANYTSRRQGQSLRSVGHVVFGTAMAGRRTGHASTENALLWRRRRATAGVLWPRPAWTPRGRLAPVRATCQWLTIAGSPVCDPRAIRAVEGSVRRAYAGVRAIFRSPCVGP